MDCVNHMGVSAAAYCQNCGKALCAGCMRTAPGGQVLCEPCQAAWQSYQQPFVPARPVSAYSSAPNPWVAAGIGVIPGVGAMYNGQFFKGLIHVVIFAVLISITDRYAIFGLFIAAWVLYQSFEAYHTAKARRDGEPLPDPLGLNEVGNWLNLGGRPHYAPQPGAPQAPANPGPYHPGSYSAGPAAAQPPAAGSYQAGSYQAPYAGPYQAPYQAPPYQASYQGPYQAPYTPPAAGSPDPAVPPPVPPLYWKRKEPMGAVVLIALGLLFLLGQMNIFSGRLFEYSWPLLLIGLGVWLIVRRLGDSQGGFK